MWKRTLLTLIVFLITISCANNKTTDAPTLGTHFLQINTQNGATSGLDILIIGKLTLDNGCLRISELAWPTAKGDSFLLIWDLRFSTRTEQGVVQVVDSSTGEVLANVGDYIAIGGDLATEMHLKDPIPDECSGPYWLIGDSIKKIDSPLLGAHFPQSMEIQGGDLVTSLKGKLALENGCLRINEVKGTVDGSSFLLIWDLRFSTRTEQGALQVIESSTGKVLVTSGDFISVNGMVIEAPLVRFKELIPDKCLGPYFRVGFGESIKKIDKP